MIENDSDQKHASTTGFHLTQKEIDGCTGTLNDNDPPKIAAHITKP